jgi:zinc transport system ATP-binding protein
MAGKEGRAAPPAPHVRGLHIEHGQEQACPEGCAFHPRSELSPEFKPDALISARGLVVSRNGRDILLDVSLDIVPGEIITIIGPNGAGKTTLVRVLLGLETPESGAVRRRRNLRIGYVPQRFDVDPVIPMTVERFLALGSGASPDAIRDILAQVNALNARASQLSQLSGGELQRVLLARALLRQPQLLVLDEPVQGVDYAGEADLYNLIARLRDKHGFAVLLVSHDLHVVMARSDRIVCLNRHVCCSGIPEAVAQHPAYVRLFGPKVASELAVYHHHHDHSHDIAGQPAPPPKAGKDERA